MHVTRNRLPAASPCTLCCGELTPSDIEDGLAFLALLSLEDTRAPITGKPGAGSTA